MQILIVTCTAFAGVLALNYQRDYTEWVLPLIIVCLFAFLVAHCFLSIFEIVVDVLFLCFAIDTKYNNGTPGREFYMDKALMVSRRWREGCRLSVQSFLLSASVSFCVLDANTINSLSVESTLAIWVTFLFCVVASFVLLNAGSLLTWIR